MDYVPGLAVSINWKDKTYNSILVIVNWLTKMVQYLQVKVTIDAPDLIEIFINLIVKHIMACSIQSLVIEAQFLLPSSSYYHTTF